MIPVTVALSFLACHPNGPGGTDGVDPDVTDGVAPLDVDGVPLGPDAPDVCDAGHDVWVQRVFPLVLGRKPHGAAEVQMWSKLAADQGRDAVVRALAKSPEYQSWWKLVLSDLVYASRSGLGEDGGCFQNPRMGQHDGSLTDFLRSNAPDADEFGPNFNMADVMYDALATDHLSTVYQANLFAKTNYTTNCAMFTPEEIENQTRIYQGDQLLEVYVDRDLQCMTCHNTEFSVTDDPDPTLDRAWSIGANFERALFGSATGPLDPDDFYAINRSNGVVQDLYYGSGYGNYNKHPWGMDQSCGSFDRRPPDYDFLDHDTSFFGLEHGADGSLWDIERLFSNGVQSLEVGPLAIGSDGAVDPAQAFAYLTAQHLVDQTWKMAFGNRLLLPYGMSRNPYQNQRLAALTDRFLANQWSLTELLVDLTADQYFNAGLPETCGADPYGMTPVIDPYTVVNEGPEANNGPGELVHRLTARVLLRSLYRSLEYGDPKEYFGFGSAFGFENDEESLQRSLGVFHSDASPGFNGVDFQGTLAWEGQFYACKPPSGSTATGFLRRLYDDAVTSGATVEELTLSMKDRLLARGVFEDDEEKALVADLMAVPMDAQVSEVDDVLIGRTMGLLCGVWTVTPEFMLTTEPRPSGPIPALAFDVDADCNNLAVLADRAGISVTCGADGMPQ
ncbi:MAG: hypothetical protein ABMB14_23970 [Myxococcota bacterium]